MMQCKRCQGDLELIQRQGQPVFYHCRPCKLPHDESGRPMISSAELQSRFNLLQKARDTIGKAHPGMSSVGKTALEVAFIQALQECYFAGLRDGVLLAYSQDYREGEPYDESVQGFADSSRKGQRPRRGG